MLFTLTTGVQATTYDAASDWLTTYPTATGAGGASSATSASWGAGNAWSAGEMSWNWTNQQASVGNSSLQVMTTYYLPSTGYTSAVTRNAGGGIVSFNPQVGTYSYTVPWQTYQFNPGQTIQQAVGQTVTQELALGNNGYLTFNGGRDTTVPTLPVAYSSAGASSGLINEVGAVTAALATSVEGFTTNGYGGGTFNDGGGKEYDTGQSGVFYNYGPTDVGSGISFDINRDFPSSATNDTLGITTDFGPTYVAWTAPTAGMVSVDMSAYDEYYSTNVTNADPGFYVLTSLGGPTAPIFSAPNETLSGSQYDTGNILSNPTTTIAGSTITNVSGSNPLGTGAAYGLQWMSGSFSVSAGETLYFASDPHHDQYQNHDNHLWGDDNPMVLSAVVNFNVVPEPSSLVLLAVAAVTLAASGLALAAWKRC